MTVRQPRYSKEEFARLFTALTPLNCSIRVTVAYWNIITQIKHLIMAGQEAVVQAALT